MGIVTLAQMSGRPIVPVAVVNSRRKDFDSWDRSSIGLPFGRCALVFGAPIRVARDADGPALEGARLAVPGEPRRRSMTGPSPSSARAIPAPAARASPKPADGPRRMAWPLHDRPRVLLDARLWAGASRLLYPAAEALLARRRSRGKEDAARMPERRGVASLPRPEGVLVWLHGASVGETDLAAAHRRAPDGVRRGRPGHVRHGHLRRSRRAPVACGARCTSICRWIFRPMVARFLDHWQPDIGVFAESELWPNLVREAGERGIHLLIVNGRMSERSFRRWRRLPGFHPLDALPLRAGAGADRGRRRAPQGAGRSPRAGDRQHQIRRGPAARRSGKAGAPDRRRPRPRRPSWRPARIPARMRWWRRPTPSPAAARRAC